MTRNLTNEIEMLDKKLEEIPAYKICANSEVPKGRVWCSFYNQTFAGRCNKNCKGYENKFFRNI